ncbi:MAG: glutathione S-transferase N-terminal domain-containing protein, partial [Alphaproteobacteria bacterium]
SMIDQLDLKATDLYGQNQDIDNDNPLRKVPALRLEDGTTLFDSTVICEFLDCVDGDPKFHPQEGHARFAALRLQALGDGLTEAPQSLYKEMARPEKYRLAEMVDGPLTIGGIALTCGLGYVDERRPDMGWRDDHPKLGDWYKAICERPSFINTTKEVNAERLGVPVP